MRRLSSSFVFRGVIASIAMVCFVASSADAISTCSARVDKRTGVILAFAKTVGGPLLWGSSSGAETNAFFNAGTCVVSGKAKKCQLADPTTLPAKTAPGGCTLYLSDGVTPCSAWIQGCSPGARHDTGVLLKDANDVVIGTLISISPTTVVRDESGTTIAFNVEYGGNGFAGGGGLLYTSSNCSGTALLSPDPAITKAVYPFAGTGYYAPATASNQNIQSILYFYGSQNANQTDCDNNYGPGLTFVAPAGCCGLLAITTPVAAAQTINLNPFAPPFKVEVQ